MHQWKVYIGTCTPPPVKKYGALQERYSARWRKDSILERSNRGARLSKVLTRGLITKKSLDPAEVSCFAKEKSALNRIKYVPESEVSREAPY